MANKINIDFWKKYAWSSKSKAELPPFLEVHPELNAITCNIQTEQLDALFPGELKNDMYSRD